MADLADATGPMADFQFLVRDRAGQFTASFDTVLPDAGTTTLKIPSRAPRVNAYAGRFVRTVRAKVTDRMLIAGERHLRTVLAEYARHDNERRPHRGRGRGPQPPRPDHPVADLTHERINRRPVLGDPINEYRNAARPPPRTILSTAKGQVTDRNPDSGTPHVAALRQDATSSWPQTTQHRRGNSHQRKNSYSR